MRKFAFILLLLLFSISPFKLTAQQHEIVFQQCYGGSLTEAPFDLISFVGGTYVLAGTHSDNGDVLYNHGDGDIWLYKISLDGTIMWQNTYGGSATEMPRQFFKTGDSGFLIFGNTESSDGDVTGLHGGGDFWLVRTDSLGNLMWQKCLGGSNNDRPEQMIPAHGGGYIGIGSTCSVDGDISHLYGAWDAWVVRISESGELLWEKTYGGSGQDYGSTLSVTTDGSYIFGTYGNSTDGNSNCNLHGQYDISDIRLVKTDSSGNIEWQQCYGGSDSEGITQIHQTSDGGFIFLGITISTDGDVSGFHGPGSDASKWDLWVVKLNSTGVIEWQRCLGGYENEQPGFLALHPDGGYLIGGNSNSVDGDINCNESLPGTYTGWLVKLDASGEIAWQRCLGSQVNNTLRTIEIIETERYLIGATTRANGGDVDCDLKGQTDIWLVELMDTLTSIQAAEPATKLGITARPNPAKHWVSFTYELPMGMSEAVLEVADATGRLLGSEKLSNNKGQSLWDIRGMSPGIYYYRLSGNGFTQSGKLVITE